MKKIKTQTVYICPETKKKCRTKDEAMRSAAAAIKAKEEATILAEQKKLADESNLQKKDWIRLNLTDIADIPKLIKEKAKEFWNLDCEVNTYVNFGQVSNSHGAPIGKKTNWSGEDKNYPTNFLGWSGRITGKIFNYKKNKFSSESARSLLFNDYITNGGFRGFHTGSGCPGDANGEYPMDIGFYFFLEDFPKLVESYELFKTEYQKTIDYKDNLNELEVKAVHYSNSQQDVIDLYNQISQLNRKLGELTIQHKQKYISDNPVASPNIDPKLEDLKKIFKTYNGYGEFKNFDYED